MKNKLFYCTVFCAVLATSCHPKQEGQEQGVITYLEKEQGLRLGADSNYIVLIFETNFCGACHRDLIDFIKEHLTTNSAVIVIMQAYKQDVADAFATKANCRVLTDKNFMLEKYGLVYVKSTVMLVKKRRVTYWSFIVDEKFKDISSHLASF